MDQSRKPSWPVGASALRSLLLSSVLLLALSLGGVEARRLKAVAGVPAFSAVIVCVPIVVLVQVNIVRNPSKFSESFSLTVECHIAAQGHRGRDGLQHRHRLRARRGGLGGGFGLSTLQR